LILKGGEFFFNTVKKTTCTEKWPKTQGIKEEGKDVQNDGKKTNNNEKLRES
jgi:hypothetical protein